MKKLYFFSFLFLSLLFFSCANESTAKDQKPSLRTQVDSLWKDVMEGHDVAMSKLRKLEELKQETDALLDSISKLPAKAKEAAEPLKDRLDSLKSDLRKAEEGMNKWMEEFKTDSAEGDEEKRANYLSDEKRKVSDVRDDILNTINKADSLIRKKTN